MCRTGRTLDIIVRMNHSLAVHLDAALLPRQLDVVCGARETADVRHA